MTRIRLIREVSAPGGNGPTNGQYALQRALRRRIDEGLDWLSIGGQPRLGEIPWFWSWLDRRAAVHWAQRGMPFVQGPNTVFLNSRRPRCDWLERALLDAPACRLMFTESAWYRRLIEQHRGPENGAPIVLWPYPIEPAPPGPVHPPQFDLLIYAKNGRLPGVLEGLLLRFGCSRVVHYGHYRRDELWEIARRSRACAYLADDDRGPLALAEILLCGCPTVGLSRGAPFVERGRTGVLVRRRDPAAWVSAVEQCFALERDRVAAHAARQFDTGRIVDAVIAALGRVAGK